MKRVEFGNRIVEYWGGSQKTDTVLIAHDGQCIFDSRVAKKNKTWRLAQATSKLASSFGVPAPLIIGIWHQGEVGDSVARGIDLSPEDFFKSGITLFPKNGPFDVQAINGNLYLNQIFEEILPKIAESTQTNWVPEKTAMIGASRGALATLYSLSKHSAKFHTALAHSPHWPIGREPLVNMTIESLPMPGKHWIWMSHGDKGFDEEYEPFQTLANQLLIERGFRENIDFKFTHFPGSDHNEESWAKQASESLRFWFKKITT